MIQVVNERLFHVLPLLLILRLLSAIGAACDDVDAAASLPPVEIEVFSSSTKEDWINEVTDSFNAAEIKTASGRPILVTVYQVNSGGSLEDILAGEIQPTIWSPGDMSWMDKGNQRWQEKTGHPLGPDHCPATVYVPTGFAMWRPMAEALGWPETPIRWRDILDLASDTSGWARYGHPEWGQLKLGFTDPATSNSGMLIMNSLVYATLGQTKTPTLEQVRSDRVLEAFRELSLSTVETDEQSARLLELMVTQGLAQLHAINTNEAETLKSNARYGKLLPFSLVFVFPADGTVWADHPFCILDADWVTEEQREAAALFTTYVLEPEQQALAVDRGLRPANLSVELGGPFTLENGTDPDVTPLQVPALASPTSVVEEAIQELFVQTVSGIYSERD